VVPLGLDELGVSRDCLNDAVSVMIAGDSSVLEDISYRPVGIKGDEILVEVTGSVGNWLSGQEDNG